VGRARIPLAILIVTALASGGAGPRPEDHFDAAVRQLRGAVTSQRDGTHLLRLLALRQLRDPALRPLLAPLTRSAEWQMQVHAVLGLAEMEAEPRLDPLLTAQLGELAQEAVVANAIDLELLDAVTMRALLARDELHPMPRLMLIGEMMLAGEAPPADLLPRIAESLDARQAGLALLLLAQRGDAGALSELRERIASLLEAERTPHVLWLLEAARQYRATAALPWVVALMDDGRTPDDVRYWSIYTAVVLDPPTGLARVRVALGDAAAYRDRVRFGLLLLSTEPPLPESAFDLIGGDEDLIRRMAAAGRARAQGAGAAPAIEALIDTGHRGSAEWAMRTLRELDPADAAAICAHVIVDVEPSLRTPPAQTDDRPDRAERVARAIDATARLAEIDPERAAQLLEKAPDDGAMQEAILLGLFETPSPAAGRAAEKVRRIGSGRADTLALLLVARHAARLEADDLDRLGRAAAGGGRVSEGLQAQAAWLYLRHAGRTDAALTAILDRAVPP
jgi:hypothetical protein